MTIATPQLPATFLPEADDLSFLEKYQGGPLFDQVITHGTYRAEPETIAAFWAGRPWGQFLHRRGRNAMARLLPSAASKTLPPRQSKKRQRGYMRRVRAAEALALVRQLHKELTQLDAEYLHLNPTVLGLSSQYPDTNIGGPVPKFTLYPVDASGVRPTSSLTLSWEADYFDYQLVPVRMSSDGPLCSYWQWRGEKPPQVATGLVIQEVRSGSRHRGAFIRCNKQFRVLTLRAQLAGDIPSSVSSHFPRLLEQFGMGNVFVLAEARWVPEGSLESAPPKEDPLIVARRCLPEGRQSWYYCKLKFDTNAADRHAEEFIS